MFDVVFDYAQPFFHSHHTVLTPNTISSHAFSFYLPRRYFGIHLSSLPVLYSFFGQHREARLFQQCFI